MEIPAAHRLLFMDCEAEKIPDKVLKKAAFRAGTAAVLISIWLFRITGRRFCIRMRLISGLNNLFLQNYFCY